MTEPRDLLIVGCGYSGRAIARRAVACGLRVTGTCLHPDHAEGILASGAESHLLDLSAAFASPVERGRLVDLIVRHRYLVYGVGPVATKDEASGEEYFADYTERFIGAVREAGSPEAMVYLSSTGIYGNRNGDWVDEATPPGLDVGPRGMVRQEVERALLAAAQGWGLPVRVLRLAGIYGPGRHVGLRMATGRYKVIEADPPLVVNRIHVDDLATATLAALQGGGPGEVYVVADGTPATLREVADYCAGLMGVDPPSGEPLAAARERMGEANIHLVADRKRCRNRKLLEDLGVRLAHPSYHTGLKQALAADGLLAGAE